MFIHDMNLNSMINFQPHDEDMAMLPLDVVVWSRMTIISVDAELNYAAIKHFFTNDEFVLLFKDIGKTQFYDFDGTSTKQNCFVTICELYGIQKASYSIDVIKELLEAYDHSCDIIIDIFTHDNAKHRISNLDGIVKAELMG